MNKRLFIVGTIIILTIILGSFLWKRTSIEKELPPAPTDAHISLYYYDNKDFYPQSAASFDSVKPIDPQPRIFITNQHILAASLIARQFALAADPKVTTVVLITQNNWNAGAANIITSRESWRTPLGDIKVDLPLTDSLIKQGIAYEEEEVFIHEHGITGIIPYVAHDFPNANVVTLVIRDKTPDRELDALVHELEKLDLSKTVIVGTIDMSHYMPKYVSDMHDRTTIQTIKEFDYQTLPTLDIDTAPTLYTLMKTTQNAGETDFEVTGHMNSSDIVGEPDLLSTTSYITGYFAMPMATQSSTPSSVPITSGTISMLFTGDVMLDRAVALHAQKDGFDSLFTQLNRLFLGSDMVIGNLEGTLTDNKSVSQKNFSSMRFTFDPSYAEKLAGLGFTGFSLSNNHSFDFGQDGFYQTKRNLAGAGIFSFGSPYNDQSLSTEITVQGKSVCLVGYLELFRPDPTSVLNEIKRLRPQCDLLILTTHWGVEYSTIETTAQKELAHEFIDAGADMIIGSHPHVVEPLEIYRGKAIFYSLGNFMFDQNFSYDTEHGLTVEIERNATSTIFTLIPITIKAEQASISDKADRLKTLEAVINNAQADGLSNTVISDIMKTYSFSLNN
jgi:poly-gamma-glutamate synthesis protein (capsule biosynthesis protein)